jgi:hypothetical protein
MPDGQWVVIKTYTLLAEADLDLAFLAGNGIEAHIQSDTAGGMLPSLALQLEAKLMVREEDASAAREVLGPTDSA